MTASITTLVSFNGSNGGEPQGSLIADAAGNLYGTTQQGGANSEGTVFEIAKGSNTATTLVSFNGSNGEEPIGSLISDAAGNLYGMTPSGGANGYGVVFEIAQGSNTVTTLVSFNGSNGEVPYRGLIADAAGNLYGTTFEGGANGYGTVFEITGSGFVTVTPAAPTISQENAAGYSATGNLTITGTATVGSVVTVYDGTAALGTTTADAITGAYSLTLTAALADDSHSIDVIASNTAGLAPAASAATNVIVDSETPVVVITTAPATVATASQTISGTVTDLAPGATVSIYDNGSTTALATATVGSDGAWSTNVTLPTAGANSLIAQDTNLAGTTGSSAAVVETYAPPPPGDEGMPNTITATVQPSILQFSGSGFDATRVLNPTVVQVGNQYTMLYGGLPFWNNVQIGLATSSDGTSWTKYSGNPVISNAGSPAWASFREVPATLMYENSTYKLWFSGDNTNLYYDAGAVSGFGYATSTDGINWTIDPTAIRLDPYASQGTTMGLDEVVKLNGQYIAYYTVYPSSNSAIVYEDSSVDGINFSADTQINIPNGYNLVAASTVTSGGQQCVASILQNGSDYYYAISTDGANFTIEGSIVIPSNFGINDLQVKSNQLSFFGTEYVGNVNWSYGNDVISYGTAPLLSPGPPVTPAAPTISQENPGGYAATGAITITGSATVGSVVTVYDGTTALGITTADAISGAYSLTLSAPLADGLHSIDVTASVNGVSSVASTATSVIVDSATPVVTISNTSGAVSTGSQTISGTVSGDVAPGATVSIYDNGSTTAFATATVGAGGAWSTTATLSSGTNSLVAQDTNLAGTTGRSAAVVETYWSQGPIVSSPTLTATENAATTALGITVSDPNYANSALSVTLGALPTDGSITLADGFTALTAGESLTVAQLTGLEFKPTTGAFGQTSSLSYTITDPASNSATGTATLKIGLPIIPPSHANDTINLAGYNNVVASPVTAATTIGPLIITATAYNNTIIGNDGNDIINAGQGSTSVTVSDANGDNTVNGSQGSTSVTLGNGDNSISLGGYNNSITLGSGDNTVNTVNAGAGNETVDIAGGTANVQAGGWGDVLDLGDGDYVLGGMSGNAAITLNWSSSASTLDLQGTAGDQFDFHNGELTVTSANGANYATIQATRGTTLGFSPDSDGGTLITLGSNGIAGPVGQSAGLPSTITETQGGVTVNIGGGDRTVNLVGYNNTVTIGDGDVTVSGSQGATNFILGNGDDTVAAAGYNNTVVIGNGSSTVSGIAGNSSVTVGNASTTAGSITLEGYNNTVTTGSGAWAVVAGNGNDTVNTHAGNDNVTLSGWGNTVVAGIGVDQVLGGLGNLYQMTSLAGQFDIMDFNAASGDVLNLSKVTAGLAPGWALSGSADGADPSALDVKLVSGGSSYLVATLHGTGGAGLASLMAGHNILA